MIREIADFLTRAVPITVAVALIIFLTKEFLEYGRRKRSDARRLKGIKTILAREIELNAWAVKSIRSMLPKFRQRDQSEEEEQGEEEINLTFDIHTDTNGYVQLRVIDAEGEFMSGTSIPDVHSENLRKYMLDAALLDESFFQEVQEAFDATMDLQHVRDSLVRYAGGNDPDFPPEMLSAFAEWGLEELDYIWPKLSALYLNCTGNDLTKDRLR